jgi:hypothetical protein
MNKSKFTFMFLLVACISINAQAIEPEYNPSSQELSIPVLKVEGELFYDVKVKIIKADPPVYSQVAPAPLAKCLTQNADKFSEIKKGMTLDIVNHTVGCNGVIQHTNIDDGILKTKYLWTFEDDSGEVLPATILLSFEKKKLIL